MTIKVPYSPFRTLVLIFFVLILGGSALLALPWAHQGSVSYLDHLFTAASAVSTTGLVTVSTSGTYTGLGQLLILIMMQLGGWGAMTVTSFFLIARQKPLPPTKERVLRASYALPEGFQLRPFLIGTVVFTLVFELLGALALWGFFAAEGRPDALWSAIFHAVSAFATAGFSLHDDSLVSFAGHPGVLLTISALALTGAVGFIVLQDLWQALRRRRPVTFTTKIILFSTTLLGLGGTLALFFFEPSFSGLPWPDALMAAGFQVLSASSTAGFNTIDIGALSRSMLFLIVLVMIIGASPSGTGGGLKTTTVTALAAVVLSLARGRRRVTLLDNEIPLPRVLTAAATAFAYLLALAAGTFGLCLTDPFEFERLFFEAASALGGVGLSTGITAQMSDGGRILLVLLMYVGRVGPLSFGFSLLGSPGPRDSKVPQSDLAV